MTETGSNCRKQFGQSEIVRPEWPLQVVRQDRNGRVVMAKGAGRFGKGSERFGSGSEQSGATALQFLDTNFARSSTALRFL